MKQYYLSLLLFLTACGGGNLKTLSTGSPGEEGNTCKVLSKESGLYQEPVLTPYQKLNTKVLLNNTIKIQNNILSSGTELSILVDRYCLEEKTNTQLSLFTKEFKKTLPVRKNKNLSREEAHTFKTPYDLTFDEVLNIANSDKCIKGITEETYIEPASNDPLLAQQTHLSAIRLSEVYDDFFMSSQKFEGEYIIAVIDTGQVLDHPDMKDQLWKNKNEVPNNNIDDDGNGISDDYDGVNLSSSPGGNITSGGSYAYHGTHVSGLAAATSNNGIGGSGVMGMNAKVMPIALWPTIIGGADYAPISVVDRGIRYAVDHGAQIINISMRGDDLNPNMEAALIYAINKGVTVIVAAANDSKEIHPERHHPVPAFYAKDLKGVLAVAATDSQNGLAGSKCSFSNYSETYVEIAAPGCDSGAPQQSGLLSNAPQNYEPTGYGWIAGTSMASPVTAGAAAMVYAVLKERTLTQPTPAVIEKILKEGSTVNPNLMGLTLGAKQIDLKAIYNYIQKHYMQPPKPPPNEDIECP